MSTRDLWRHVRTERAADLPTSAAGTERAIALLIIGCQLGTVIQMVPSLPQGAASSPHPRGYVALWLLAAGVACAVSAFAWSQRRPPGSVVFGMDVGVTVVVLLLGIVVVPEDLRIGTWMGYQNGYALAVVCTGAGVRSQRAWLLGLAVVMASMTCYLWGAADPDNGATVLGNLLTLIVIGCVGRWVATYIRRVAADGDAARAQALELGRREEERRAQLAIHNGATVIRMLGDPTLDAHSRELLRVEAQREAVRMRSYLRGSRTSTTTTPRTDADGTPSTPLAHVITRVSTRFADLPITTTVDLVRDILVNDTQAAALDHALASILLNVRDHAHAESVIIHADSDDAAGQGGNEPWTITVHDDGVGFTFDDGALGVGLREVVIAQLAQHGIRVEVASSPGQGTRITLAATA